MTAQPLLPIIDNATYNAERNPISVLRSVARRVQLGPFTFGLIAEDWPSILNCEIAASRAGEIIRLYHPAFEAQEVNPFLDTLADRIRAELEIDPDPQHPRPFGCSLICEPL